MKRSPGVATNSLAAVAKGQSPQEDAVWKQEDAYWEYVKKFDLERYRALWHPDFVGWPQSCTTPVRKVVVTDWIVPHKGETLTYELQPAAIQLFGDNLVVTHYWVTAAWDANSLKIPPQKMRITHTWMRSKDGWQIIGGMSAPDVGTALPK